MRKVGFKIDISGQRFGRLFVLGFSHTTIKRQAAWSCRCDCGRTVTVIGNRLKCGKTKSCGCLRTDLGGSHSRTHGMSNSPEYRIYHGMLNRCYNEKVQAYPHYGGRGITVCDRWRFGQDGVSGFECFLADMGRRKDRGLSLERKENDGNYAPTNCRWATYLDQANNSRRNHMVNVADVILTLSDAVRAFGAVPYSTVLRRMAKGWSAEDSILTPPRGIPGLIVTLSGEEFLSDPWLAVAA